MGINLVILYSRIASKYSQVGYGPIVAVARGSESSRFPDFRVPTWRPEVVVLGQPMSLEMLLLDLLRIRMVLMAARPLTSTPIHPFVVRPRKRP